ncbi:MAG: hypothetical protein OXM57_05350 [bacterium]|nr:hypothetical protein [bacterium]MDE0352095.1 hypothetical protein [bacterium]
MSPQSEIGILMEFVSSMICPLLVEAQENGRQLSLEKVPASVLEAAREITEHEITPRVMVATS